MFATASRKLAALVTTRTGVLGLTTVGNLVVRTLSSVILTRLLSPNEFGIVGIISSVFVAVALVTDLGFLDFVVRHERADERHFRNVLWTIHARRGVAVFAGVAVASPLIAWAFGKPVVALPLAVASLTFALNGLSSLSLMTALRHDKSRELSLLDFGLQIVQTTACLLLAWWWHNAWSIIAAMILQSAMRSILSYRLFADSAQHFARDRDISREFFIFSRFVLTSSALALIIGQSDKVVLGRVFTLGEFGLYAIALTIASAPVSFAEGYVNRIVFPICSRIWREARHELVDVYYGVRRMSASLYAFACGGLIGSASLVVAILYDPRYAGAATFLSLLMVATAFRLPNVAASQLMIAVGQVKQSMHITIVRAVWVVLAIPLGLFLFGPIGVVGAIGLVEVPAMIFSWTWLRRLGVLSWRDELAYLGLVFAGAAIGWAGSAVILRLLPHI